MILKSLYSKYLKSNCDENLMKKDYRRSLHLKICFYNSTHLPMLVSDEFHHVAAHFTEEAIIGFRKRHGHKLMITDLYDKEIIIK